MCGLAAAGQLLLTTGDYASKCSDTEVNMNKDIDYVTVENADGTKSEYTIDGYRHKCVMDELKAIRKLLEEHPTRESL